MPTEVIALSAVGAIVLFVAVVVVSRSRRLSWWRSVGNGFASALGLVLGFAILPVFLLRFGLIAAIVFFGTLYVIALLVVWRVATGAHH